MPAFYGPACGFRKSRLPPSDAVGEATGHAPCERIGILIRAEALAGGRDVRNKGIAPARRRTCRCADASPTKTLWDDRRS